MASVAMRTLSFVANYRFRRFSHNRLLYYKLKEQALEKVLASSVLKNFADMTAVSDVGAQVRMIKGRGKQIAYGPKYFSKSESASSDNFETDLVELNAQLSYLNKPLEQVRFNA